VPKHLADHGLLCLIIAALKKEVISMQYAVLAYHVEGAIEALTPEEDAALMVELRKVDQRLTEEGKLGPAARLGFTQSACTLRNGIVLDGPFAETKEQLLGFYLMECDTRDEVIQAARDLARANPTAVYEIRPVVLCLPGAQVPGSGRPDGQPAG